MTYLDRGLALISKCDSTGGTIPMCGDFSYHQAILQHQLSVLQFALILTLPEGSISSHRLRASSYKMAPPPSDANSPGCHLCFRPSCYRWKVSMTPSLILISLLEWLTDSEKHFLTRSLVYYKRL